MSSLHKRKFQQYDVVEIISFSKPENVKKTDFDSRKPEIGDIATIVEIYTKPSIGYELECVDSKTGNTIWMQTFDPFEVELELH